MLAETAPDPREGILGRCSQYTDPAEAAGRDALFDSEERHDAVARVLATQGADLYARLHVERYEFAASLTKGLRVLDCACGAGYGSWIMSLHGAPSVLGVDLDRATIEYADRYYRRSPSVAFRRGDALALSDLIEDDVDCVVSFETLEHLPQPQVFLDQVQALLRRTDGMLVVSSPPPRRWSTNPYHLAEWPLRVFASEISRRFGEVELFAELAGRRKPLRELAKALGAKGREWVERPVGIRPLSQLGRLGPYITRISTYLAIAKHPTLA